MYGLITLISTEIRQSGIVKLVPGREAVHLVHKADLYPHRRLNTAATQSRTTLGDVRLAKSLPIGKCDVVRIFILSPGKCHNLIPLLIMHLQLFLTGLRDEK